MMQKFIKPHFLLCLLAALLSIAIPAYLLQSPENSIPLQEDHIITEVPTLKLASIDNLTARPIFNAKRSANFIETPAQEEEQNAQVAEAQPIPEAVESIPLTLVGLASGKNRAIAIVKDNAGDTVNMKIGNVNNGWRLVSIGKSTAAFINNGTRQTLSLNYENKAIGGPISSETGPSDFNENAEQSEREKQ